MDAHGEPPHPPTVCPAPRPPGAPEGARLPGHRAARRRRRGHARRRGPVDRPPQPAVARRPGRHRQHRRRRGATATASPPLHLVALGDSSLTGPGLASPEEIWLRQALESLAFDGTIDLTSLAVGGSAWPTSARWCREPWSCSPMRSCSPSDPTMPSTAPAPAPSPRRSRRWSPSCSSTCRPSGSATSATSGTSPASRLRSLAAADAEPSGQRQIEAVVARHPRAVLLDVTPSNEGFRDRTVFADDLFHPNVTGHALWAESAREGLAQLLATRPRAELQATPSDPASAGCGRPRPRRGRRARPR